MSGLSGRLKIPGDRDGVISITVTPGTSLTCAVGAQLIFVDTAVGIFCVQSSPCIVCTELCVRACDHPQAFLLMCIHMVQAWAGMLGTSMGPDISGFYRRACTHCRCGAMHGSVCLGFCRWACTQTRRQMYAHACRRSMCLWSREVGAVPGQELQVHRARTQAAGARAGHVCAQLRVLASGRPDARRAPCSR